MRMNIAIDPWKHRLDINDGGGSWMVCWVLMHLIEQLKALCIDKGCVGVIPLKLVPSLPLSIFIPQAGFGFSETLRLSPIRFRT